MNNGSIFAFKPSENQFTLWKGVSLLVTHNCNYQLIKGGVPYDGFPDERIHQTPLPIAIIYSIMATVGLIFAITCLVFNVVFRQKR